MTSNKTGILLVVVCSSVLLLIYYAQGAHIGDSRQEWGHIEIRPGVHIFWWLYFTKDNVANYTERPLIIWLQGGPGEAASCIGNFFQIGPLNIHMNSRNYTWTNYFNVLFVDYPIDVGFSYGSSNTTRLPRNLKEVGDDLVSFTGKFFTNFGEFRTTPLYIFGQSYGAKFATELATRLHQEMEVGKLVVNLKGIGSFSGYISPMDSIANYGRLGLTLGVFDNHLYNKVEDSVCKIKVAINRREFEKAIAIHNYLVISAVDGFDMHNIMEPILGAFDNSLKRKSICKAVIRNVVRPHLNINDTINWQYFNTNLYEVLESEMLESVTDKVEYLLNKTDIKILVLSGMFDFLVNVAGTVDWMGRLKWNGTKQWERTTQTTFPVDNINEAFVRKTDRLALYIVLRAGHNIPMNNPKAVLEILRKEILEE